MTRFIHEYKLCFPVISPCHIWSSVFAHGGIHLHISDHGELYGKKYGERYSGGIEIHYRQPPEYMRNDAPSNNACWLLGGPCWHDGSSLQATETWIPRWQADPHDHEAIFRSLDARLLEQFGITVAHE